MVDLIGSAVAGGLTGFIGCYVYFVRYRIRRLPPDLYEVPLPIAGHEHVTHVVGTVVKGGVKNKLLQCSRCNYKWAEPV
jgi:hypothetical protein